jgi:serine/threonine protein kinase
MTLVTGSKLGPYEIVATVGAGGMGEVYRARDTRLNPITPGWSATLPLPDYGRLPAIRRNATRVLTRTQCWRTWAEDESQKWRQVPTLTS